MILAAALMLAFSAPAQVFMLNENESQRDGSETPDFNINNPEFGDGTDFYEETYVPVGSGALLLAGLAGAYLIGKKKK